MQQFEIARLNYAHNGTNKFSNWILYRYRSKKVVSKLTTESREESHKLSFGASQYIGLIII